MGTAVLRSQDFFHTRFPHETLASPSLKQSYGRNPNRTTRSGRRKRSPSDSESDRDRERSRGSRSMVVKFPTKNLVMGQVKILKRGEPIDEKKVERSDVEVDEFDVFSKNRLGPEPEMIPKEVRLTDLKSGEVFAGSGFVSSPSPSSLPFPAFFTKKDAPSTNVTATKDLCRLLRIDLL